MHKQILALALITAVASSAADASLLRFDFAGNIVATYPSGGPVSPSPINGFLIVDSQIADERPDPNNARYAGAVVDGSVLWDGVALELVPNAIGNDAFVLNDSGFFNDFFALTSVFSSPSNVLRDIYFQLGDSTRSVFSDDSLPSSLTLSMFDEFQLDNVNSTGIFIGGFGGAFQGEFTFAELRTLQMPAPATAGLFVVALLAWRAARPSRNSNSRPGSKPQRV